MAYLKARLATEVPVANGGGVYLTVRDEDKADIVDLARDLVELGYDLYATPGTADVHPREQSLAGDDRLPYRRTSAPRCFGHHARRSRAVHRQHPHRQRRSRP